MKLQKSLIITLLFLASTWAQANSVTLLSEIPYAEDAKIRANVRRECVNLGTKLAKFTQKFGKKYGVDVQHTDNLDTTGDGRVLDLVITNAVSRGNAFMGHRKYVDIAGTLWENGNKVASFTGTRISGGGVFAGYKGSCSVLGRCVKTLGKDIARWLKDPIDDAHLGD